MTGKADTSKKDEGGLQACDWLRACGGFRACGGAGKRKKAAVAGNRKKAVAASGKPKRPPSDEASGKPKPPPPPSPLNVFFTEFRQEYNAQHPDEKDELAVSHLARATARAALQKWRDMSKQEKQPYVDQSNQKRKQYYEANRIKTPPSPFAVFRTEFRQEYDAQHPDNESNLAAVKAAAEKWLDMSEQEKQPYVDQANQKKKEFEVDDEDDEENDDDE